MLPNSRLTAQLNRIAKQNMFGDTGYLIKQVWSGAYDSYGKPVMTESNIPVICSFTDRPTAIIWQSHVDLEIISGEVRFNSASEPTKGDKFKVVGRFGTLNYPDKTYEIVGTTNRDIFGFVCALKAVSV